ncbi:MAG: hypothetical protein RLZZ410_704 [Pseudomonadota bacterium]|jgi:uncharacterized protein (TIGR02099 family)
MSWLFISTSLDKLRQLKIGADKVAIWKKRAKWAGVISALLFVSIHLLVRFYFWPMVEKNKTEFEKLISHSIGADLRIGEIQTDWHIFWPEFKIKNVTIYDAKEKSSEPLLSIPEITGNLSWETLWEWQPHFHNLKFENARIHIKRDTHGNWDIAGIKLDKTSAGFKAGNWIFDQDSVQINQAEVIWLDQYKQTSEHHIQIESLNLKNKWFTHKINLALRSPWNEGLAKVDGQFRHNMFGNAGNWRDWNGLANWDITNLDLKKINRLIEGSINIVDGTMTTKGNAYLNSGLLDGGRTDIQLSHLHFEWDRLGQPLKIMSLQAEILQDTYGSKMTISAPQLNWQLDNKSPKQELNDLSLYWKVAPNINSVEYAGIKAVKINIALVEQLAKQFPLPKDIQRFITNYQPSGELEDLDASWNAQASKLPFNIQIPGFYESHYKISFGFNELFLKPLKKDDLSISNFSGKLFATELGGEVNLNNRNSSAQLPGLLEDDYLDLKRAKGLIKWVKHDANWDYEFKNMYLENNDLALQFDATYQSPTAKTEDHLTIKANIEKAKVLNLTRYFPAAMSKNARTYINGALKAGQVTDGTLRISGSPTHLPFNSRHPGIFELNLPIENVEFHPAGKNIFGEGQWSAFSKVNGRVVMKGPELILDFQDALFESVELSDIHGSIQDVTNIQSNLKINGQAAGLTQDLLKYYLQSPSGQPLKDLSDKLSITGSSKLKINIDMPLADVNKTSIKGEVSLISNTAIFNKRIEVKDISGEILFSEESISAKNLRAKALGGDIAINNTSNLSWANQPSMKVQGKLQVDQLIQAINPETSDELLKNIYSQVDGSINYDGKLLITPSGYQLQLGVQLNQLSANFPAPFNKKIGQAMNGEFELSNLAKNEKHSGFLKIGKLIDAPFAIDKNNQLRANLGINTPGSMPSNGVSLNANLAQLNVDEWEKWLSKYAPEQSRASNGKKESPLINSFTASIGQLKFSDKVFKDIKLSGSFKDDFWQANINSNIATGSIQWRPARVDLPQGKLTARLQKLIIEKNTTGEAVTKSINNKIQKLPALDIVADQLVFNNHDYGKLYLIGSNDKNDWKIDKLSIKTPDALLEASGRWELPKQSKPGQQGRTQLNVELDIDDAGKLLDKLGFPKTIDGGSGKLIGQLNWAGAPYQFDIASLQSDLSLDLAKGTILQVDPGVGRLLGVLSYQGLTRIATLDIGGVLKPIVAQGTPFDRITAQGRVQSGIAKIQDLTIKGPQGNVRLTGSAHLVDETQDMRITVVPNLNAGSASLAYTFVNPIIGLSTLVGQYLIADEFSKLFQLDYLVQGTWAAPQVIALDAKGQPLDENKLKEIRDKSLLRQQQNPNKK